jgi:hypothetical protein
MRNFDPALATALAKEVVEDFFLLELDLATPVYITNAQLPVIMGGNKYLPQDFNWDAVSLSSAMTVDKTTVELDNTTLQWSEILLSQDCRGKGATISNGIRLSNGTVVTATVFVGYVDEWEIQGYTKVNVTIANELAFWDKKTLRQAKVACPWSFKFPGGECGYTGAETWCDQSPDRCEALGNFLNFGGEKFIDAIVNETIQWGRVQIT